EMMPDYGCFTIAWTSYGIELPLIQHVFGIQPDAINKTVVFDPPVPTGWEDMSIENLAIGTNIVAFSRAKTGRGTDYAIEAQEIPTSRVEVLRETGKGKWGREAAEAPAIPLSPVPIPQGLTPITGPAARLVQNMTDSLAVPTATSFREITVDVLDARRRELNAQLAAAGKKISYTHLIGYAIARAARELPVMTHAFRDVEGKPHRFDPRAVNLGLAVD